MVELSQCRLSDRIALELKRRIERGEWRPEQKLPSESALCREYDVSQSTIKAALRELKRDGAIRSHQGKGSFVCAPAPRARTGLIAVVLLERTHLSHPVLSQRLLGIETVLTEADYHLAVLALWGRPAKAESRLWLGLLDPETIDGAVLVAQQVDAHQAELLARSVPVCWCDRRFLPPGIDTVRLDYVGGAFSATEHLLDLGHRRIALCTSCAPDHQIAADQREGFRLALQTRNALAGGGVVPVEAFTEEAGRAAAADLLARVPRPTAVICGSDDIARGLFAVLAAQGVRVPQDLSLISWNDTIGPDEWPVQPTTVAMDFHRAGVQSARCLLARIRGAAESDGAAAGTEDVIPARLVVRGTTRRVTSGRRRARAS